jgi:F-box interacting protein
MLPDAEGTVRVINPATRRSLTLPGSPNKPTPPWRHWGGDVHNAFGFGRDPHSGAYKVARFFHSDFRTLSEFTCSIGIEVFTIGEDSCWREIDTEPPPYPFLAGRTATFFKGSLIWTVDLEAFMNHDIHFDEAAGVPCFLRFNLEDESFSVMAGPQWYPWSSYEDCRLADLHGELAMTCIKEASVEIWMFDGADSVNPLRWVRRHVLIFLSNFRVIAALDGGIVFQGILYYLSRLTSEGSKIMVDMTTLKYRNPDTGKLVEHLRMLLDEFDVIPYTPTLVPI